jgi:polyphosphate glucokinase
LLRVILKVGILTDACHRYIWPINTYSKPFTMSQPAADEKILSIDIGGSRIKAILLDVEGGMLIEYNRVDTPAPSTPQNVIRAIGGLAQRFPGFTRVSVGFPGYVKRGIVHTAPNLGTDSWQGTNLSEELIGLLGKPVRVVNDADLQGLGIAKGNGLEMVVTLGTGFGTSLLMDGILLPHLELAHHPFSKEREYDEYIGNRGFLEVGVDKWNRRLQKVIATLVTVFNYDHLYISGGNAKKITFPLNSNISLATNLDGIRGGAKLWSHNHYNV